MKKITLLILILLNTFIGFATNEHLLTSSFNSIDLELSASSPDLNPAIYSTTTANFIIRNDGNEAASNINISIPVPDGFVLTGSNPFSITDGTYSSFFGTWKLDNLPAGASATLTLNLYSLSENPVSLYGEISSVDQTDTDSTPGNGTAPTPVEDDEVVLNFYGVSEPVLADLTIADLTVPASSSLGVFYTLEYQFSNIGKSTASGPFTVYFYYSEDDQLSLGDQQIGQQTFSNIPAGASQVEQFDFVLLSSIGITPGTGFIIAKIDNDNTVLESNENNNIAVSTPIIVDVFNNNGIVDLELSLDQANSSPDQYSTYSVELFIFNNGTAAATDVKVNVPRPDGVVYSGGNPFNLNFGQFSTFTDVYSISSISPGETVILELNYFLLDSSAPGVYAQITQLNEEDLDSTPNNGTPPIANEDDEASTGGNFPPFGSPDLALNRLDVPTTILRETETFFSYRLTNIGTATAEGTFAVNHFYSTDDQLDAEDLQFGQETFADYQVDAFNDVTGIITIEENLDIPNGPGFIIIKADNDNSVIESSEDNNIVSMAINVRPPVFSPECAVGIGLGNLSCITDTPEGGKEIYTVLENNPTTAGVLTKIGPDGSRISEENIEIEPEVRYTINNNILRITQSESDIEELTIPAAILDNYAIINSAIAFNDGYMLFAYADQISNSPLSFSRFTAILTDENLNPIAENLIGTTFEEIFGPTVGSATLIAPDQVAIISTTGSFFGSINMVRLIVIDDELAVVSNSFLGEGNTAGGSLTKTLCGDYTLQSIVSNSCGGTCFDIRTLYGNFVNGRFISDEKSTEISRSNRGVGNSIFTERLSTIDGGEIFVTGSASFPVPGETDNQILIEKTLDGNVVFSKTIELEGSLIRLMEISGDIYLLIRDETDQMIRYYNLDCLDEVTPPSDGVDLELTSELSVASPDIYSNYSVVYTLVNNGTAPATDIEVEFALPSGTVYKGSNPFSVSRGRMSPYNNLFTLADLPAGESATIQLNYFSLTDSTLDHYAEVASCNEEDVDSTPDNGTPPSVNEDDETAVSTESSASIYSAFSTNSNSEVQRLKILKLYPNPVMEEDIRMTLNIPESAEQTFVVFNNLGVEVLRTSLELSAGFNEISLPTQNLSAGMYRVMLPGNHTRFGSASFMVIE